MAAGLLKIEMNTKMNIEFFSEKLKGSKVFKGCLCHKQCYSIEIH